MLDPSPVDSCVLGVVGFVVPFVAASELFRMAARRTGLGGENR